MERGRRVDMSSELARAFDMSNASRLQSETLERIWQEAYGAEYAAEVVPNAFYPMSVLKKLEAILGISEGGTLVDLGCGHAGAGLWLAPRLGKKLIGIDISEASLKLAERQAASLGFSDRATFVLSDMTNTGLEDGSCAAVISLDALLYVADKEAALREAARILRPGGYLGITSWEQDGYSNRLHSSQISDHRPVFKAANLKVILFEEPDAWRSQQRKVLEGAIENEQQLRQEIGEDASGFFVNMARGALQEMAARRYVFVVGKKSG